MSTHPAQTEADADASTLEHLVAELEALRDRIASLEADRQQKAERIDDLETQLEGTTTKLEQTTAENERLEERVAELEQSRMPDEDRAPLEARLGAHAKKLEANKTRLGELQARELEKGAHLREENVDPSELELAGGRLERIRKDDANAYVRVPESDDPLERGGNVSLAHGDLLPIQQLARMDEDMLRSTTSSLPSRLAAKLWKARTDSRQDGVPARSNSDAIAALFALRLLASASFDRSSSVRNRRLLEAGRCGQQLSPDPLCTENQIRRGGLCTMCTRFRMCILFQTSYPSNCSIA